jgi:hypothetical protein
MGTPATLRGKPQVEEMWKSTIYYEAPERVAADLTAFVQAMAG